jgi:hypothetical protein
MKKKNENNTYVADIKLHISPFKAYNIHQADEIISSYIDSLSLVEDLSLAWPEVSWEVIKLDTSDQL